MTEDGAVAQLCTQARIATAEVPFAGDLMDAWQEPTSHLLMSGPTLDPFAFAFTLFFVMLLAPCDGWLIIPPWQSGTLHGQRAAKWQGGSAATGF